MATSTEGVVGRGALLVGHAAGMLDLVSMPLWVGVLIQYRHLSPPEAGLLLTTYMLGVFVTSVSLAPRFDRLPARAIAIGGFIVGALAFLAIIEIDGFAALVPAHFVAGIGAGSALSMVHGTISRSVRPHRLFAIVNFGVAIFSLCSSPSFLIWCSTVPMRFSMLLGGLLILGALAAAAAFPQPPENAASPKRKLATIAGSHAIPACGHSRICRRRAFVSGPSSDVRFSRAHRRVAGFSGLGYRPHAGGQ